MLNPRQLALFGPSPTKRERSASESCRPPYGLAAREALIARGGLEPVILQPVPRRPVRRPPAPSPPPRPRRRLLVLGKPPKPVGQMTDAELEQWADALAEGMKRGRRVEGSR